ncbi:MAG: DUF6776 family protein, partial [Gammaproteobacteria bacterium]|nr:DUF6776 family protein [Gammaproteobacteria bacterium]
MRSPRFQVRQVDAERRVPRWLIYPVLVVPSLLFGYWVGSHDGTPNLSTALARFEMQGRTTELERENDRLVATLAIAERSVQVADESAERLRQEMMARQEEIRALRTELSFYRGVLAERGGAPGLRIHRLESDPLAGRLEVVLVRGGPVSKPVKGWLELRILSQDAVESDPDELAATLDPQATLDYEFEFFQRLAVRLPEPGAGGRVLVTVRPE